MFFLGDLFFLFMYIESWMSHSLWFFPSHGCIRWSILFAWSKLKVYTVVV